MVRSTTCEMCGTGFSARSDAVYCSSACRQKAHRARAARRIADLQWQQSFRRPAPRVLVKPDVAGTIARARRERRRTRELSRIAAEILKASAETHEQLKSVVWLHHVRTAASEPSGSGRDDVDTTSRQLG